MKIVKSTYLNENSTDFDEIWYLELDDSQVTKCENFKTQDGERPPFKKNRFLAITRQPIARF